MSRAKVKLPANYAVPYERASVPPGVLAYECHMEGEAMHRVFTMFDSIIDIRTGKDNTRLVGAEWARVVRKANVALENVQNNY
jgi:hypothetical protein